MQSFCTIFNFPCNTISNLVIVSNIDSTDLLMQIKWYDYSKPTGKLHDTFYEEVEVIKNDFIEKLKDFDICFMHDILYQGWHYIHNVAIREAQKELPNLRFISFTHSYPAKRPEYIEKEFLGRYMDMPNTLFAYPTKSGLKALANQYNVDKKMCSNK